MQKKTKFRSPLIDFFVVLFCLTVSVFFIWLFWKDLNKSTVRTDQDSIASISFKYNIAQRKFSDRIVWERIKQNSLLYNNDIIRTADYAQATIHFKDGSSLELFENSMIQISQTEDGNIMLSVEDGDVQVSAGEDVNFVEVQLSDGSKVKMDAGGTVALKSDPNLKIQNIEVKSGSAKVTSESGENQDLTFGESVNIENGGKIKLNPLTVIFPPKEKRLLNLSGKPMPVDFEWRINGEDKAVIIETSDTKDFNNLLFQEKISGAENTEISVGSGNLYWRLYSESEKDKAVQGLIMVEMVPEISTLAPANASEFSYRGVKPKIGFRWTENSFADHYRLIISETADMQNVVVDINTEDPFTSVNSLEAGSYFWQVMPYYSLNDMGYDQPTIVQNFTVVKNDFIAPPKLYSPADASDLTYKDGIKSSFLWNSEVEGDFELLLSKDSNFTNIVYKKESSENRLSLEFNSSNSESLSLDDGIYYWKVIRHSSYEEDSKNESEIRSFRLSKYLPKDNSLLYPKDNFSAEIDKLLMTEFMWTLSDIYEGETLSIFQISKDRDFIAPLVEKKCNERSISEISLPVGDYYWRVGAAGSDGLIEKPTSPRKFTVLSGLEKPVFISPASGEELLVYGEKEAQFSWQSVNGADYYNVKIFDKNEGLIAQKSSVKGENTSFSLDADSYICRVQAVAEINESNSIRMGETSERAFSVRKPSVIQTLSPSHKSHVSGLKALRSPLVFTWKNGNDKASLFNLIVQKYQSNGSWKTVARKNSLFNTSASLSRLTSGRYRYQILAKSDEGVPVNSEFCEFIIDAVSPLSRPVLLLPKNGSLIDETYLKSQRTVTFSWQKVPEATNYSFKLYKRRSDGSLKLVHNVKSMKSTSLTIRDLSTLDIGNFIWNVTAYTYASDGYLERSSRVASGRFKIDFGLPSTVESIKPGTMYAE